MRAAIPVLGLVAVLGPSAAGLASAATPTTPPVPRPAHHASGAAGSPDSPAPTSAPTSARPCRLLPYQPRYDAPGRAGDAATGGMAAQTLVVVVPRTTCNTPRSRWDARGAD